MIPRLVGTTCRVPLYALLLLLTFGLTLGLAGCGGEQPSSDDQSQSTSGQDEQQQTQDEAQDEETMTDDATDQAADETQADESSEEDDTSTADSDEADETEDGDDGEVDLVARGQTVAQSTGCLGCHSTDGSRMVGPTWQDVYGHEVELQSGETVTADEAYIRESIRNPSVKIVQGYPNSMPSYGESQLSEDDLEALIAYMKSLSDASEGSE